MKSKLGVGGSAIATRQLNVSQHSGLGEIIEYKGGFCSQKDILTLQLPLTCMQPSPGVLRVWRVPLLSCDAGQVCQCAGSNVEELQTNSFPFRENRPPAFVWSPPQPPNYQFPHFFPPDIKNFREPSSNRISLTWKHSSWPFCPRCLFSSWQIKWWKIPSVIVCIWVWDASGRREREGTAARWWRLSQPVIVWRSSLINSGEQTWCWSFIKQNLDTVLVSKSKKSIKR